MNPYQLLDVPPDADDALIRQQYLEAIKRFPPEQCPEEFQRYFVAYESIRNEEMRMKGLIGFKPIEDRSPGEIVNEAATLAPVPDDLETLKRFLRALA